MLKALVFDVFGTVVDWRGSIAREGEAVWRARGVDVDWAAFADAWRGLYQPSMERVRSGDRGFVKLDELHRENLDQVLADFGVTALDEASKQDLNRIWHRLDPWPDSVSGLTRLKSRFTIGTLSNGNIALMVNMAKRAGLPWDVILGAEVSRQYKPHPDAYLNTVAALGLDPAECMLVAAHNSDLKAAGEQGMQRAFVPRPDEYGGVRPPELEPELDFEYVAADFNDLADQLGCQA
ncbi:MAG: haloacid dehalogenase type II [Pseudomonadota bacterium]